MSSVQDSIFKPGARCGPLAKLAIAALLVLSSIAVIAAERVSLTPTGLGRWGDCMGCSVALLGDTALIGAPNTYVSPFFPQGTAIIYRNDASGWHPEAQLTLQPPATGSFGSATALGPDLAIVGAAASFTGMLLTFERSAGTWTQVDSFSANVASEIGVSGNTLVSGGTAYVRAGSGWQAQVDLQALTGDAYLIDNMAIDGDLVVAAAGLHSLPRKAYFFSRSGNTWAREGSIDLTADSLQVVSVALSGSTALIGVPQDSNATIVRVFDRDDQGVWHDDGSLDAGADISSPASIAIDGDVALVGSHFDGTAYTFVRAGGTWTRDKHFADPDFGCFSTVALSGSTALAGCPNMMAPSGGWGKADIFSLDSDPPAITAQFDQGNVYADEILGSAVALSGSTLAAIGTDGSFIFERTSDTWTLQTSIPSQTPHDMWYSVALDGNTLATGYEGRGFQGLSQVGIYVRTGQIWSQQALIEGGGPTSNTGFASSLALGGDTLVVGESGGTSGTCHIYERAGVSWSEQAPLWPDDTAPNDGFCNALALDGNTLLVGASHASSGIDTDSGAAYVFVRSGGTWTQQARLVAPVPASQARFGRSVALAADTVVVGAVNDEATRGAAYVYTRNGGAWSLKASLANLVADLPGDFGKSVGVSESQDRVLVGAPSGVAAQAAHGLAYEFAYDGSQWSSAGTLQGTPPYPPLAGTDAFGYSIAFSGSGFAIGAIYDGVGGAVYHGSSAESVFADGFDPTN